MADPLTIMMMASMAAQGAGSLFGKGPTQQIPAPTAGETAGGQGPLEALTALTPDTVGGELNALSLPPPVAANTPAEAPTSNLSQPDPSGETPGSTPTPEIGEILAALPEAIAVASDLLGFNTEEQRIAAPVAGSPTNPGQLVQGFDLPRGMDIGTLLSALPRLR